MEKKRPVNLSLWTIRFPIHAIVSILHRISGLIIFLFIPLLLWMLEDSLSSATAFNQLAEFWLSPVLYISFWIAMIAFIFHFFAGIRHLLMDMGLGEGKQAGRCSAWAVILIATVFVVILVGLKLW